jgi:hypothetical protein
MTFPDCFQLAVAATVSLSALSAYPQSMRATEMDTSTTITSLTSLHSPRHASPPFGAIDATANDSLMLNVSAMPDLTSAESGNQVQAGRASGHSSLSGSISIPFQPIPLSSLRGRNLGGATGSLAASSRSLHAPVVGNISQRSIPNALPASNSGGLPPHGQVHPGPDVSGFHRPTSDLYSSRSRGTDLGDVSASASRSDQSASDSDNFDSQSASDVSSENADTLNVDASTIESNAFEVIGDPLGGLFQGGFAGRGKPSRESEGFAWDTSESARSNQPSHGGALKLGGKEANSRLKSSLGRLSDDAPGSGSQAQRRLNDSNRVEPGSSDSVVLRKSPN